MSENVPGVEAVIEADPKRPYKTYVAAGVAAVLAGIAHAVADVDPYTWKDALQTAGAAIGAGAAVGLPTYFTRNPLVSRTLSRRR